jgi:hypothetical protein
MNTNEIKVGKCYLARFSKVTMPVRLEQVDPAGGWVARSLIHGRCVKVKDVFQLLEPYDRDSVQATTTTPHRRSKIQGPTYREPLAPVLEGEAARPVKKVKRPPVKRVVIVERLNLLDAAHRVLSETKKAMTTREIVAACAAKQYWSSKAATPHQTLTAALNRDIVTNGTQSRFTKVMRGKFALQQ